MTVRPDRTFTFELRTPPASWMLLQAAGVEKKKGKMKGAMNPGSETVGKVSLKHVYEIAKIKRTVCGPAEGIVLWDGEVGLLTFVCGTGTEIVGAELGGTHQVHSCPGENDWNPD